MCPVLIWVIWEEIKAKYHVADIGQEQCCEYSALFAQSSLLGFYFYIRF